MARNDLSEIVHVFIPGMQQKLDELSEVLEVLLEEGPNPSAIELVYRTSFSLKSLAAAFEQQEMIEFIGREFDTLLNRVRMRAEKPSPAVKASFHSFVEKLRKMVEALMPESLPPQPVSPPRNERTPSRGAREDSPQLLSAIGQMSIWSFHDITNVLAKLQGYTEMLEDCRAALATAKTRDEIDGGLEELSTIQQKITENVEAISDSIARIRMARGKISGRTAHLNLRQLVAELSRSTLLARYNVTWSAATLPNVTVEQDRTTFALAWVYLWRLLAEWMPPETSARAMMEARVLPTRLSEAIDETSSTLQLHLWMEARANESVAPPLEKISFSANTPLVDLGGVFGILRTACDSQALHIEAATLPSGFPVFRLTLSCEQEGAPESRKGVCDDLGVATPEASAVKRPYILVVDDEKDLRNLLSIKLAKMGYPTLAVESIAEARVKLQEEQIGLVLADLFLSQESGLDLLREVRSSWPDIAFLFMSGANEDDVPAAILKVLSMYANAFLRKPIPNDLLKETIDKYYQIKPN